MAQKIEITTAMLSQDAETVQNQLNELTRDIDSLQGAMGALNGMWTGSANAAYNARCNEDVQRLAELINKIVAFRECMGEAVKQYNECENKVAQMVNAIWI